MKRSSDRLRNRHTSHKYVYKPSFALDRTNPKLDSTTTTEYISTTTLDPSTVTSPSSVVQATVTVTPKAVTSKVTKALATITLVDYSVSIVKVTQTKTATCITPVRQPTPDPTNTDITAVLSVLALETSAPVKLNRRDTLGRRQKFAKGNHGSGLKKRSPGMQVISLKARIKS